MVFITHASLSRSRNGQVTQSASARLLLAALLFAMLCTGPVVAEPFTVRSVETVLKDKVYLLNARINYKFSAEALKALESGVPLLILMDVEVEQVRWWWNKEVATLEQGYLLLYHALTEKYIVNNLNSGAQNNYATLYAALAALGYLENFPILDANLLSADKRYIVRLRVHLDIESLPAPMRPLAYISSQWQLASDWYTWPLQQ